MTVTPDQLLSALNYCTDFAKTMLENSGEFYPFGAIVNVQGDVEARGAWTGEEHPNGQDAYRLLIASLHQELLDGHAVAIAAAADVNIPEQYNAANKDGLRILLEAPGYRRFIYYRYRIERQGLLQRKRTVRLLEPFSVDLQ